MKARKAEPTQPASSGSSDEEERKKAFGHEGSGYGQQGIGYPGAEEEREGTPGPHADREERPEDDTSDDARTGYGQTSGYPQSGGTRADPAAKKEETTRVRRRP